MILALAPLLGIPAAYWLSAAAVGGSMGLGQWWGHKRGMREIGLTETMLEQQGRATKVSAIQAKREQARIEKLYREAMRMREKERMDNQMMQILSMMEGGRQERIGTLRNVLTASTRGGQSNIPLRALMGGF